MQSDVYHWLKKNDGWRKVRTIAEALGIQRHQRVTRKLQQLQKFGFVERKQYNKRMCMFRVIK